MNYDTLKGIILGKGYKWFEEPENLNIIGIRTQLIVPNVFNDLMIIGYIDAKGEKKIFSYTQTTLPGKFWLNKPTNPKGCAILIPGQYINGWIKGTHGKTRPHDALIQYGGPVNVFRDNDKDDVPEFEGPDVTVEKGVHIGLNIHATWNVEERKYIDKDSAACQVASMAWAHEKLMSLVDNWIIKKLGRLPSNKEILADKSLWVPFSYTLLLEKDLKPKI